MSRFKLIDKKLEDLSFKLGAILTKDRPSYPEALRTFEERRIDWEENGIYKAIIIQPNFEIKGINHEIWNLINVAWADFDNDRLRIQWIKDLIDQKPFIVIEQNIDTLLHDSEKNLKAIKKEDLK